MARCEGDEVGCGRRSSRGCAGTSAPAVARDILRLAIIGVWAAEPRDLSLLHVLFYIRSAGSIEILTDTEGGAQQDRVVGGTQLISIRMAEQLGPDVVVLENPVRRIGWDGDAVEVVGDELTRPGAPGDRRRPADPRRPDRLRPADARRPRRPLTADGPGQRRQVHGRLRRPFWRDRGLSGAVTSVTGPVSVGFDNSPPDGRPGVLLGFLEGRAAREAMDAGRDERRALVAGCFARLFGPEAADPVHYVDRAWAAEEWSRGCYGGFMPPGAWSDNGAALRAPVGSIHWAGAETATVWNGYMDGAVGSGRDAAEAVLNRLREPVT